MKKLSHSIVSCHIIRYSSTSKIYLLTKKVIQMDIKTIELSTGQKIAYRESGGSGYPVLLVHGNSASSKSYKHQLEGDFGSKHRVIAMDLPGHGDSSPAPASANYTIPGYAAVVVEVAKALDVENAVVVGWSLGGHIVLEAHDKLDKAAGFVIFGTPPLAYPPDMANAFMPNPAMGAAFAQTLSEEEAQGFAAAFFAPEADIDLAPWVADVSKTDGKARATMAASIEPGNYADEVEIVANLKTPLAILHGEKEQLVNVAYISELNMSSLWHDSVQMIPDAGHAPHWEQADKFNALLEAFIQDVTG